MLKPSLEVWAVSPSHLHLPLGLYFQWLQSDMADDFGMAAGIGESTKKIPILEMLKGGIIYLEKPRWHRKRQLHHPCVIIFLVLSIFQRFEDLSFQIHRISTLLLGQLRWVPDAQEVWMAVC